MKYLFSLIGIAITFTYAAKAEEIIKQAPQGFDTVRTSISHGKIDTVSYKSTTVGTTRKALIEKNFRAKTDANSRALAGLSLVGIRTLYDLV